MNILFKSKTNQYRNQYQFKIEILPEYVQRELFYTLPLLDQPKLLSINQKWRTIFLPFMWEYIRFTKNKKASEELKELVKQYENFIKLLDLNFNNDIIYSESVYKNAKYFTTSLYHLIHRNLINSNIKLVEVSLDNEIDGFDLGEYISINKIDLNYLLKNVKILIINSIDNDFIENIIPLLPPWINQIQLDGGMVKTKFIDKFIMKLPEMIHFSINDTYFPYSSLKCFEDFYFLKLQSLEIRSFYTMENPLTLSSEQMPQLTNLKCRSLNIQFNGQFNIREISMKGVDFYKTKLNKENIPNIRILKLQDIFNFSFKDIYNIFHLTNLISLTIESDEISNITLLNEIYPKHINHLVELNLVNFSTDSLFYQFLFSYCRNLTHLSLGIIKRDELQPLCGLSLSSIQISPCNLELIYFSICYYDDRYIPFLDLIITNSPKLCILKINNTPETFYPKKLKINVF